MIEAKPNTELRNIVIKCLDDRKFCGPNYSIDDVSAFVSDYGEYYLVSLWDMEAYINKSNINYNKISELIKQPL